MKQTKKFSRKFSLLTIFILFMSIITSGAYAAKLPFTDVPEKAWYYEDVKSAYESDLISGKKPTKYAPDDNMTAAEAVKLAAAMYMLKNEGKVNFSPSKPWYKVYVDYAKQKNLITDDLAWNKNITRAGYMQIFANILTDEESKKNEVADGSIPDVPMTHPNAQAIYKLYKAGIVTGVDDKKNCSPGSNIKRSEVAAILIRMMDVKRRLSFSLGGGTTPGTTPPPGGTTPPPGGTTPPPATTPLKITKQPQNVIGDYKGEAVTLEVKVEGGKTPYSYQWQNRKVGEGDYSNIRIVGEVTNVLTWIVEGEPYDYRCIIADANGDKVTSAEARIELKVLPFKITKQPENLKLASRVTGKLKVEAEGGKKPYFYQWFIKEEKRDKEYFYLAAKGSNTDEVDVFAMTGKVHYYKCEITDSNGNKVTSNVAKVEEDMDARPLIITKHPQSVKGKAGDIVTLEVQVSGGKQPYSYNWKHEKDGYPGYVDSYEEGKNTNILRPPIYGNYRYKCTITDANGKKVTTVPAVVSIDPSTTSPYISRQPENATGKLKELVILDIEVSGGKPPYSYQWQYRSPGSSTFYDSTSEGNKSYIFKPPVEATIYFYKCIVTDSKGEKVTSIEAKVEREKDANSLRITKQPKDAYGDLYDKVTLEVEVEGGVQPYNYQWYSQKLGALQPIKSSEIGSTTKKLRPYVYNDIHTYYCRITDAEGTELQTKEVYVYKKR
ncbi:hypothetical protein HMPREF0379_0028 [[Eubacterium] yurii subsp. margaretiae ATCC 43715]|nr:hypothetical protein HMPREF0379_0028 [[Eubacterium] yurii subsp. margaretiae ATCC 43715]